MLYRQSTPALFRSADRQCLWHIAAPTPGDTAQMGCAVVRGKHNYPAVASLNEILSALAPAGARSTNNTEGSDCNATKVSPVPDTIGPKTIASSRTFPAPHRPVEIWSGTTPRPVSAMAKLPELPIGPCPAHRVSGGGSLSTSLWRQKLAAHLPRTRDTRAARRRLLLEAPLRGASKVLLALPTHAATST